MGVWALVIQALVAWSAPVWSPAAGIQASREAIARQIDTGLPRIIPDERVTGALGLQGSHSDRTVISAYHLDSRRVRFSMDNFAWRDSAPAALRRLEGTVPGRALRTELLGHDDHFGSAVFKFRVPLPDSLRSRHYLLIHGRGITSLRPESLVGTARVLIPDSGVALGPVEFYGEMRASPRSGQGSITGGFVLVSDVPLRSTTAPSRRTADELFSAQGANYVARATAFWAMRVQFAVMINDDPTPYVFVQWAPDKDGHEGFCQYRFSLFRLSATPIQVAGTDYGCDI
jgi:hypothetical protein